MRRIEFFKSATFVLVCLAHTHAVASRVDARPLTNAKCAAMLVLNENLNYQLPVMERVTQEEIDAVTKVPGRVDVIAEFLTPLFGKSIEAQYPHCWTRWFRALWQRIPEMTTAPIELGESPTASEIEREWVRFKKALLAAPRAKVGGVPQVGRPTVAVRIKFKPSIRDFIMDVDQKLRVRVETLPFDAQAVLEFCRDLQPLIEPTFPMAAEKCIALLWKTYLGGPPRPWTYLKTGDARAILKDEPAGSRARAGARLIEEFRIFKMIYNRNRTSPARVTP